MKDLIIIGASGFGKDVAWLVERINQVSPTWNILGFLDDDTSKQGQIVAGYPVLGTCEKVIDYKSACYTCAVGTPKIRYAILEKIASIYPVEFATLIDPSAIVAARATVGKGSIICAGNILVADVTIGEHVIINLSSTIGHDAVIGDFVSVCPGVNVSGNTTIGKCTEIGTGAKIIQGKTVADNVIIGAGAVVVRDIVESGTYVGVPAHKNEAK